MKKRGASGEGTDFDHTAGARSKRSPSTALRKGSVFAPGKVGTGSPVTRDRRRITNINPNVTIGNITKHHPVLPSQRSKQSQPNKTYTFKCSGEITAKSNEDYAASKHIEWSATFEKPLEQLIYPSLQRFDTSAYDEKKRFYERLHGHTLSNSFGNNLTMDAASENSTAVNDASASGGDGEKMFLYTPSWTAKISDADEDGLPFPIHSSAPNNSSNAANMVTTSKSPFSRYGRNLFAEIERDGELYLREKLKKSHVERLRKVQEQIEKDQAHGFGSGLSSVLLNHEEVSNFDQLVMREIETRERNDAMRKNGAAGRIGRSLPVMRGSKMSDIPKDEQESAEALYSTMLNHRVISSAESMMRPLKLNKVSAEEEAFNRQKKGLRETLGDSQDHLFDGILYYRLHNDLNRVEAEERKQHEESKMALAVKRSSRKFSNTFSQRLQARRKLTNKAGGSGGGGSVGEIHIIRNEVEDMNLISASQYSRIPARDNGGAEEVSLSRIRRARGSQLSGFYEDVQDADSQSAGASASRRLLGRGESRGNSPSKSKSPQLLRRGLETRLGSTGSQEEDDAFSLGAGSSVSVPSNSRGMSKGKGSGAVGSKLGGVGTSASRMGEAGGLGRVNAPLGEDADAEDGASSTGTYSNNYNNRYPEQAKRQAQDKLLFLQLDASVLPEAFIKPSADPAFLSVDLSNYGIGDKRGICLGKCLANLDNLQSVGLCDNRLTAASLPTIISNLSVLSVMHLDLAFNSLHETGSAALASYFGRRNSIRYLDISNCGIACSDIRDICKSLITYKNNLEEWYLSCNRIGTEGAASLCSYLSGRTSVLYMLDLSWNNIGEAGAISFSQALQHNKSLTQLDLASNSLGDLGGQRLAASIASNTTLKELNISQNVIKDGTSFVVSQVLIDHPSMRRLDMSLNPLGEAGARSIFRTILRGLQCFVIMRGCIYKEDKNIFNFTYPALDSPYTLDLSEPYKSAVFAQLLIKAQENPSNCKFENMTYQEQSSAPWVSLLFRRGRIVVASTGETWSPATQALPAALTASGTGRPSWTGVVKFQFLQSVFVPVMDNAIDDHALNILQVIVENGRTEADRKQWLALLCQDIFFTTKQAQSMIDRFVKNKTIGEGGLTKLDIIKSLWNILLDTENMFDFLCLNADREKRRELVFALTFKRYKFNWVNPTGYWNLNLADKVQRAVMLQLTAINNSESEFSKNKSGRGDTSQQGTWFNFRNERYTVGGHTKEITIDAEFLRNMPIVGNLSFDYVSTARPSKVSHAASSSSHPHGKRQQPNSARNSRENSAAATGRSSGASSARRDGSAPADAQLGLGSVTARGGKASSSGDSSALMGADGTDRTTQISDTIEQQRPFSATIDPSLQQQSGQSTKLNAAGVALAPVVVTTAGSHSGTTSGYASEGDGSFSELNSARGPDSDCISDDEFYYLMDQLGLSTRHKTSPSNALYVLMDLQLASTKHYFTVENMYALLDHFTEDWDIQSKVVVAMFSRIKDLHNIDRVLRILDSRAQQDIMRRLGVLNVMNPLKISFDYIFSLKYLDNRILLIQLMELAAMETADNIIEHPKTELPIATLYGSYTRALNETRPETMRFTYADFGERTQVVAWAHRRELVRKFLVGTQPIDKEMYRTVHMYKELEFSGALGSGPIDLQYATFVKTLKSRTAKAMRSNAKMVSAMKSLSVGNNAVPLNSPVAASAAAASAALGAGAGVLGAETAGSTGTSTGTGSVAVDAGGDSAVNAPSAVSARKETSATRRSIG